MTVVSSKEFTTHPKKYFGMAIDNEVCIKRGQNMFYLMHKPVEDEVVYHEPDEDFYRSITMDELLEGVLEDIHQFYANK